MAILLTIYLNSYFSVILRSGSSVNPDLIIGYKSASMTLAMISFLCPLVMVINKPMKVITSLYVTVMVTMFVCLFTKFGFPYSVSQGNLAPHRALIIHTDRQFFDMKGTITKEDTGYFMVNLDRNSPHVLNTWLPELKQAKLIHEKDCEKHLYCGAPIYYPASSLLRINHWIPAPGPKIWTPISLQLTHQVFKQFWKIRKDFQKQMGLR